MKSIGLIGGGNMGEAIIAGTHKNYAVYVCEARPERTRYLKSKYKLTIAGLPVLAVKSDCIILAVKPQDFGDVLNLLRQFPLKNKLVVSIAAGITTAYIEKQLGQKVRVIRVMPNMPAFIGEGISAVCAGKIANAKDVKTVSAIFDRVGTTLTVPERLMDAITVVSGSGPAFVFYFAETQIKAAQAIGLSAEQAKDLVYKTLTGSAHLLVKSKDDAATLRAKVTSKGGTTQAALETFMKHKMDRILKDGFKAGRKRAKDLARK